MNWAEQLKIEGNKAYKNNEYKKAAKIYRDAIHIDVYNPTLYSNRAQCFLHLGDYERALKDTTSGLKLGNSGRVTVKLNYRQGMALLGLGRLQDAEVAFWNVLLLDPQNERAREQLAGLEAKESSINRAKNRGNSNQFLNNVELNHLDTTANMLPMHYLTALKHVSEDKKINGYRYILDLKETTYVQLFKDSGIDTEFLDFYLHAARCALVTDIIGNPDRTIMNHLRLFASFKRFDLAMEKCDVTLKQLILKVTEEKFPQLRQQIRQFIK